MALGPYRPLERFRKSTIRGTATTQVLIKKGFAS